MQEYINNQAMLKVGTILRGTYRIDSYLSSGGFGNTYVATNIEFDERVAIKEFFMKGVTQRDDNQTTVSVSNSENHSSFLEQREKFKKEARRIRQLKNEHIVAVHDLFEENGTAYYVMDYVDGENLSDRLKRTGKPMTENEVNQILPQILDALKSIHDAGIWHLDLKPENIMVDLHGNVKLIDFGASKQLNIQKGGATTSTAISYTNGYAPREQMEQNYDKFGPWTDIYALGATLYNLLTNKRSPLPSDIDDDITEDKRNALPFPENVASLRALVLLMMKTNRMQRPQNVDTIFDAMKSKKEIPYCSRTDVTTLESTTTENEEATIIAESQLNKQEKKATINQQKIVPQVTQLETTETNSRDATKWFRFNNQRTGAVFLIGSAITLLLWFLLSNGYNSKERISDDGNVLDVSPTIVDSNTHDNLQTSDENKVYDVVEEMPTYPGGQDALVVFLSNNIKYPKEAEEEGIEGKVFVTFIVEPDGIINDAKVVSSAHKLLDQEAIRVIKSMPKWIPGKQNGVPVRVKYTVPISFRLE